jgi:hypothetical protein
MNFFGPPKNQNNYNNIPRLALLILIFLDYSHHMIETSKQNFRIDQINCPTCGIRKKSSFSNMKTIAGVSSLECRPYKYKQNFASFKCQCQFVPINANECKANISFSTNDYEYNTIFNKRILNHTKPGNIDESETSNSVTTTGDCLTVHVGMAVRGFNLLHRKWINKEHCFELCLKTKIKNGDSFDCHSFEHWHRDCNDNENKCASFTNDDYDHSEYRRDAFYKEKPIDSKIKRSPKMDICVLSNQTIKSANKDFLPNNAVTYYEITCKSKLEI